MKMRAERGWASFKMSPQKWVVETAAYNTRLNELEKNKEIRTIPKNPRALVDKLMAIEIKVMYCLTTKDYTCKQMPLSL